MNGVSSAQSNVATNGKALQTLGQIHLAVEARHDRQAVLSTWAKDRWIDMPDWRFHRQIIRIALFLKERVQVRPGESVAIASPPRVEWLVADWAAVLSGAVAVTVDPALGRDAVTAALAESRPRVAFVAREEDKNWLLEISGRTNGELRSLEKIVVFEGLPAPPAGADRAPKDRGEGSRWSFWSSVLDLGGTLDTAERAQAFRGRARELAPGMHALAHFERTADGANRWRRLTHGEVIGELRRYWSRTPPRKGDVAYVSAAELSWSVRLASYAFTADGFTRTAVGTPGREAEEIATLEPQLAVAPKSLVESALPKRPGGEGAREVRWRPAALALIDRANLLAPIRKRLLGEAPRAPDAAGEGFREVVDFQ
jgi:AMP-binding enzyme